MKIVLTLGLSLALGTPCLAAPGGETPPNGKIVETTLSAVRRSPDAYMGVWVSFDIQFTSMGRVQNPFFTQFVPSMFANFYGWAAEQPIWRKEEYDDVFGMLFLDKRNEQLDQLYKLKTYQRVKITGVVRNVFQGEPWIEVKEFSELSLQVNTAVLSHLYRGEQFMAKRQWNKAISELSLAPGSDAPTHVQGMVHKDLGICYLRLGESGRAVSHLNSALSLLGDADPELQQLAQVASQRPEAELDRTVSNTQIQDHERPMWEAFEEGQNQRAASPRR